jgi:PAS domain S-box-containing protein
MPESETPPAMHGMSYPGDLRGSARLRADELQELRVQVDSLRHESAMLQRERSKYVDLFRYAPDAYLVTDPAGVISEANLAAGALFRAEPSSLAGRSLIALVTQQDARHCESFLETLKRLDGPDAETAARVVLRIRPRGHSVFVVFARVTVVAGDGPEPVALRWTLRSFSG